ncbi:MAG: sulfotransferase [Thermoguttaceae bacterium]
MRKIDFFVAGFGKCGTTTLCSLLGEHPDIFIPKEKEPSYFAAPNNLGWPKYVKWFEKARPDQKLGEGSTAYSVAEFAELACGRILECNPDARFIFIVRNPFKRLESSYREFHHGGDYWNVMAPYSIGKALQAFPNILDDTQYWRLLNVYRSRVPDSQILILFLEDFQKKPDVAMTRCYEFLGVDPTVPIPDTRRHLNAGGTKYYDSRMMRFIRKHDFARLRWEKLSEHRQAQLTRLLRLRKPFRKPIKWDAKSRAAVIERLREDVQHLLRYCGKPLDFWPEWRSSAARAAT